MRRLERQRGTISLVETIAACAVFALLVASFFVVAGSTVRSWEEQSGRSELVSAGHRAVRAIQDELRTAGRVTIAYPGWPQPVSFPFYFDQGAPAPVSGGFFTTPPHSFAHPPQYSPTSLASAVAALGTNSAFLTTVANRTREVVFVKPAFSGARDPLAAFPDFDPATAAVLWRRNALLCFRIEDSADGVHQLVERVTNAAGGPGQYPDGSFPDGETVHVLARHVERITFEDPSQVAGLGQDQVQVTIYLARLDPDGHPTFALLRSVVSLRNTGDPATPAATE